MEYYSSTRSATLESAGAEFSGSGGGNSGRDCHRIRSAQCRQSGVAGASECGGKKQEFLQRDSTDAQAATRCTTVEWRAFPVVSSQGLSGPISRRKNIQGEEKQGW